MAASLQIYDRRERALVRLADVVLWPLSLTPRRRRPGPVQRVLLLRLERIGDMLMTVDAIRDARATWPGADIDLVVGGWNRPLADLIPGVTRVETMSVSWLAREGGGDDWPTLIAQARRWRTRRYDVAVNFEPDIRSNLLLWFAGAPIRVGYSSGGGRAVLTSHAPYDPGQHVATNARQLIARAAAATGTPTTGAAGASREELRLTVPRSAREALPTPLSAARRPLIGVHVSGGRESKQWHLDRFADAARRLATEAHGTIVLTGAAGDRALVDEVVRRLPGVPMVDAAGATGLVELAAVLETLDVLITGDTGPMHLAAAVGTPVVALFGPSDPARYGPRAALEHILVAADVPCRPCGQVRLPPVRCRGHVPDCMSGITVDRVVAAARDLLARRPPRRAGHSVSA
jgi:ADP-heptose:LPS heptosyltransferase